MKEYYEFNSKINPDGKEKDTDNNLPAKTSFEKFKQEMLEELGEKEPS